MASTYSPSLKLELIGNGDQSGTWGTTTNTNLGTLLEQAITGVQAITMVNADYTLSNLNGAADEARNAVLVVGGTNAAIRNIIAPAVEKLYVIRNNTVGGFAIVIKTSASTGVSIANGTTASVYCDGSEFYLAVPPYASTNAASTLVFRDGSGNFAAGMITANLTGNVTGNASTVTTNANLTGAVTSVGNATSLGSFTSANLAAALTDETGTGANVFANSPTLVTPALGTPSALVGTNITGTAAGLSIGGNAATATSQSGGTVAATTGSFSGVATFSAGSAGAPALTTTGDTNTGVFFPAADTIAFSEGGTEAMRIDSAGNVGIGTSVPGLYRLRVNGGDVQISNTSEAVLSMNGGSNNFSINATDADYAVFNSGGNGLGFAVVYGSGICAFDNATSTMQVTGNISATNFLGNATTASNAIGVGQTWQDVSGSRSAGTTYTNSTGRSIFISVRLSQDDGTLTLTVAGLLIGSTGTTAGPQNYTLTAIVPAGITYSVTTTGGTLFWYELR